ncbi:hypothetical protein SPBR_01163 [Sporothrix brasiliensis 5110]|uniref:Uncharacterized protein n=1 Tax=Sporothrix brasiliensis 5110 TaxID=1398154 RepID=A0A0C2ILK9_9PEZI|nr:uncharacterized protein SPBR_01163 [Sporothrix brasiliensis 5110]KIH89976.1 hypothetical protein SPBR_01163 [Sporothrix brasiliensis 5110]
MCELIYVTMHHTCGHKDRYTKVTNCPEATAIRKDCPDQICPMSMADETYDCVCFRCKRKEETLANAQDEVGVEAKE